MALSRRSVHRCLISQVLQLQRKFRQLLFYLRGVHVRSLLSGGGLRQFLVRLQLIVIGQFPSIKLKALPYCPGSAQSRRGSRNGTDFDTVPSYHVSWLPIPGFQFLGNEADDNEASNLAQEAAKGKAIDIP